MIFPDNHLTLKNLNFSESSQKQKQQPDSKTKTTGDTCNKSRCEEVPSGTQTHRSRGKESPDKKLKTQHTNIKSRQLTLGNTARGRRQSQPQVQEELPLGLQLGFRRWQQQDKQVGLPASTVYSTPVYRLVGNQDGKPNVGGRLFYPWSFKQLSNFLCRF